MSDVNFGEGGRSSRSTDEDTEISLEFEEFEKDDEAGLNDNDPNRVVKVTRIENPKRVAIIPSPLIPKTISEHTATNLMFPDYLWPSSVRKNRYLLESFELTLDGETNNREIDLWMEAARINYEEKFWEENYEKYDIDGYVLYGEVVFFQEMSYEDYLVAGVQFDLNVNQTHVAKVKMTRDDFGKTVPQFETYRNQTQVVGVETRTFSPEADELVECTFKRVECSGLESVYGHKFQNWHRTKNYDIVKGKWQFWLWQRAPGASDEAGFRMQKEEAINVWVGEYQRNTLHYWSYGNFTAILEASSLLVSAFALLATPALLSLS